MLKYNMTQNAPKGNLQKANRKIIIMKIIKTMSLNLPEMFLVN